MPASLDWGVIVLYLSVLLLLGILLSHSRTTPAEYFLASRKASWPTIGLALIGSTVSAGALIGVTGSAYAFGISVYNYDWMATVILIVFALFFLPAVLAARVFTMPEFLEQRFDWRVRLWFSSLTLLLYILLDAAGALYCGSLVLRFLLPGLSFQAYVLLLAGLSVIYSVTGGLRAVMYTQAVQAVIVLVSAVLLSTLAVARVGGLGAVLHATPADSLSLIRPASDPTMPWTGLAFGMPVMALYFWCTNQVIVQRMLAARSIEDGQKGALLAGFLKLSTLFLIVLPGVSGRILHPDLKSPDEIYLHLAFSVLPSGLLGVLLAAFLGALMAQLSATYNSAATLMTMDFARRFRPQASDKDVVIWGRLATVICMVASALWAPQIVRFPSLWQYFQAVLAYATPPAVALFLAGMLWPRANAAGAVWAVVAGSALGFGLFGLDVTGQRHLQFLNAAAVVFLASGIVLVTVSLCTSQSADERARAFTLANVVDQARLGVSRVKLWAVLVATATATIVIWFR